MKQKTKLLLAVCLLLLLGSKAFHFVNSRITSAEFDRTNGNIDRSTTVTLFNKTERADRLEILAGSSYQKANPGSAKTAGTLLMRLSGLDVAQFGGNIAFRQLPVGESVPVSASGSEFEIRFFKDKTPLAHILILEDGAVRSQDQIWIGDRPLTDGSRAALSRYLAPLRHRTAR